MSKCNKFFSLILLKVINIIRKVGVFKRLIIFFLILIILPTSAIAIVTYNTYTAEIKNNISNLLSYTTRNVAQSISQQMSYYENLVYTIYFDDELMQMIKSSLSYANLNSPNYLDLKQSINHKLYTACGDPSVFNLQIITPLDQFTQISHTTQTRGGYLSNHQAFVDSSYYSNTKAFKGHPVWFDTTREENLFLRQKPPYRPIIDTLTLMKSIPIYEIQDSIGIIVLNVYLKNILDRIDPALLNQSGNLLLVTPDTTLVSINANLKGPIPTDVPALVKSIAHSLQGVLSTKVDGSPCLIAYEKLPNSNLYVLNLAFLDVLTQNAKHIRSLTLLTMSIVILIAILVAYIVTLSITLPLNKLKGVMGEVPYEDFKITFTDKSNDEIGLLGHHFNDMISKIHELIHKVYLSEIHSKDLAVKKKQAELNALQMQINPHFLYNTLDIIRWEIISLETEDHKLSQMIESFSNFLRLSIKKNLDFVPLSEEINHLHSYLETINYRYTSKIILHIDLDADQLTWLVPKLTLQPLIENCILHAFKGNPPCKDIMLRASINNYFCTLYVIDNGIGMSPENQLMINTALTQHQLPPKSSIGLYNVHERIQLYFGLDYGLSIIDTGSQGTTIAIKLPLTSINRKGDYYV